MKFRIEEVEVPEDQPFKNDHLNRKPVVEFVRDLICRLEGPFVLALDSPWGTGKTTVVRMLRAMLKSEGFSSVYFNAWKEDYVSDPLIPMVAALDDLPVDGEDAAKRFGTRMAMVKGVVSKIAKRGVVAAVKLVTMSALDLDEIAEDVVATSAGDAADDLVADFKNEKQSVELFRQALENAVSVTNRDGASKPLVFFVDELDRCRPTFAIELLERIKHLFDVSGLVFVVSVDRKQLEAITAAVYGERIDAPEYLRRFIDLDLSLPAADTKSYARALVDRHGLKSFFDSRSQEYRGREYDYSNFVDSFSVLSVAFGVSLRVMDRCMTRFVVVLMRTANDHYLDPYVVSFLIVVRAVRPDWYASFVSGELSPTALVDKTRGMPGSSKLESSGVLVIIEAYLIAGDFHRERRELVVKQLKELANDEGSQAGIRARELVEMLGHVTRGRSYSTLSAIKKIDLAAQVIDG